MTFQSDRIIVLTRYVVGNILGFILGPIDGLFVGLNNGGVVSSTGVLVRIFVGVFEGLNVGLFVGIVVGLLVGIEKYHFFFLFAIFFWFNLCMLFLYISYFVSEGRNVGRGVG